MAHHWTEDNIATLERGWAQGETSTQIARTIGCVSRHAVMGMITRRGLIGRNPNAKPYRTGSRRKGKS